MPNILAHGYFKTDVEVLWRTVTTSIPKIVAVAKEILARRMSKICSREWKQQKQRRPSGQRAGTLR
jgi:hypothetical protein